MEKIISELKIIFNSKINEILNEYANIKNELELKQKLNIELNEKNINLQQELNKLLEEKKIKSSSLLWETTQNQLREKDLIIDNLKKDIEFYKRNYESKLYNKLNNNTVEKKELEVKDNLNNNIDENEEFEVKNNLNNNINENEEEFEVKNNLNYNINENEEEFEVKNNLNYNINEDIKLEQQVVEEDDELINLNKKDKKKKDKKDKKDKKEKHHKKY